VESGVAQCVRENDLERFEERSRPGEQRPDFGLCAPESAEVVHVRAMELVGGAEELTLLDGEAQGLQQRAEMGGVSRLDEWRSKELPSEVPGVG